MSTTKNDINVQEQPGFRASLRNFLERNSWENFILILIVVNAILLGLETNKSFPQSTHDLLVQIDRIILAIFVVEITLRLIAYGRKFWTDPWSLFDFTIVAIALIPSSGSLSVLRAFRILRALRLISSIESMRTVVSGLLRALPGMGSITLLLLLISYISAVMATSLFGEKFPEMFGSVGGSAYTLFQVMTLDGWSSEIVRPVMKEYPSAWVFFIIYILVTAFAVLNLFIGIICEAMQNPTPKTKDDAKADETIHVQSLIKEIQDLKEEVKKLKPS